MWQHNVAFRCYEVVIAYFIKTFHFFQKQLAVLVYWIALFVYTTALHCLFIGILCQRQQALPSLAVHERRVGSLRFLRERIPGLLKSAHHALLSRLFYPRFNSVCKRFGLFYAKAPHKLGEYLFVCEDSAQTIVSNLAQQFILFVLAIHVLAFEVFQLLCDKTRVKRIQNSSL